MNLYGIGVKVYICTRKSYRVHHKRRVEKRTVWRRGEIWRGDRKKFTPHYNIIRMLFRENAKMLKYEYIQRERDVVKLLAITGVFPQDIFIFSYILFYSATSGSQQFTRSKSVFADESWPQHHNQRLDVHSDCRRRG